MAVKCRGDLNPISHTLVTCAHDERVKELTPAASLRADVKVLKVYVFLEDGVILASASHSYVGSACQAIFQHVSRWNGRY